MTDISDFFDKNDFLKKENPLRQIELIEAQKSLLQSGFKTLPENFIELLKISNGIQSESGMVLGVWPQNKDRDITAFNLAHNRSTKKVILGYDDLPFWFMTLNAGYICLLTDMTAWSLMTF